MEVQMIVDNSQSPNSVPWPPLILAVAMAASLGLGQLVPLPLPSDLWLQIMGSIVAFVGVALDLWAILTMRRLHTNILPHRAAGRLVTTGPFRFTRNPIYVGNATLMAGIGFAFGNCWFVLLGVVSALVVDRLAIRREERHLGARFGQDWLDYASRVPRWLI